MRAHHNKSIDSSPPDPEPPAPMETYTFTHKFTTPPPILYCYSSNDPPKPCVNAAESLVLLESVDLTSRLASNHPKKKKFDEESKAKPLPKLRLDSVKAAIKVALKCRSESGYEQQQGFAENMRTLSKDMGVLNTIKHVLPKIPMLLVLFWKVKWMQDKEDEEIQMKVLEQIPEVTAFSMTVPNLKKNANGKIGKSWICGSSGDCLTEGAEDHQQHKQKGMLLVVSRQVSDKAVEVMLKIAQKLTDDDRGKYILTDVLSMPLQIRLFTQNLHTMKKMMTHGQFLSKQFYFYIIQQLLSKLAEIFGTELCEQFVTHEIMSLAEDPSFKVRKAVAEHLVEICKVVAPITFTQKMFPLYCTLAADTIWGVRKAAADNIVEVAKLCDLEVKLTVLTSIMLALLQDISQWVQRAALQRLGEFIATLMPSIIPTNLVDSYATMAVVKGSDEEEVVYQCAYNFPAVLYACGKSQWEKLRNIYLSLWDLDSDKVTHTLCCSIHEIAKILGSETASDELLPIFLERVQDIDENLIPLLENASDMLSMANEDQEEEFLENLQNLLEDSGKKWRVREAIANHLFDYAKHYTPSIVFKKFWGIAMMLCGDNVWHVRKGAAKNVWRLLDYCKGQEFQTMMKSDILSLAEDSKWNSRQLFCLMCMEMWQAEELLADSFIEKLAGLAKDKVPGVRISVANALKTIYKRSGIICDQQHVQAK
eukprot:TRINITY_DN88052_c0_g1_i1.p1 TRINITY_DN88052_c0_g1~~TRINITY_DN88052_c0_g1_i1.p1  ORF type:complete len:729 (-),score=60.12 TRINITY_DN88052_c0_g1_i1:3672-5789(-)